MDLHRLPGRVRRAVRDILDPPAVPRPGAVKMGDLRRTEPVSRHYGYDRGNPIDRYYIERFLRANAADIRGRVLEVGEDMYSSAVGGSAVKKVELLHAHAGNPAAAYVADIGTGEGLPPETFDAIVMTQTLQLVFDLPAAIRLLHRSLVPGGVLLTTMPGISQLPVDEWAENWYWSFTDRSVRRLFEGAFPPEELSIEAHGNVLTSVAFLHGLADWELTREELDRHDPLYQMLITVRARRPKGNP
jgi:SAM-dependent methyltransferase